MGIANGRLEAEEVARGGTERAREGSVETNVSCAIAIAIEYRLELMRREGLLSEPAPL